MGFVFFFCLVLGAQYHSDTNQPARLTCRQCSSAVKYQLDNERLEIQFAYTAQQCLRILLSCLRKRMSDLRPLSRVTDADGRFQYGSSVVGLRGKVSYVLSEGTKKGKWENGVSKFHERRRRGPKSGE